MFYQDERLALFIDGANLHAAAKSLDFEIDFKLLREEFLNHGKLLRAYYYTALMENDENSLIKPLVDWLTYNGFTLVTKSAKEFTDSQGNPKIKGNMDIVKLENLIKEVGVENYSQDGYHVGEFDKQGRNKQYPEKRYSKKNHPLQNKAPFYKTGFMGINPDHKGYCTPMTKATCTPPRKALAKRLNPGGDLYKGKT